ncbi:unnamed protein product [Effrenium voratum]|nr:unnamed protein product [Effrenium voratum]
MTGSQCESYVGHGGKLGEVDFWYKVDLGISGFCLLTRFYTVRSLTPLIEEMDNPPPIEVQDDPVRAMRSLLSYYLNTGSQAIMRVDSVSGSFLYALTNWSVLFNLPLG